MKKIYVVAALMLLVIGLAAVLPLNEPTQAALSPALYGVSIVIDAGHGGADPGKVGGEAEEKDINLEVARNLAEYCRAGGASVTLTREGDSALADSKSEDMKMRVSVTEAAEADIFISLHCNSYVSSASQHGAQTFYQSDNAQGQQLAEYIQAALISELGNTSRTALTHPDSYLLKNLECAAVICEMGFLSNSEEEALLQDSDYQWQLAWSIYCGVLDYLDNLHSAGTQEAAPTSGEK